jgi:hypothetical protein
MFAAQTRPLGISLQGFGRRDQNLLELFLEQHWASECLLVSEPYADLCLLDLDAIKSRKILQMQQESRPWRPLIVISAGDVDVFGACVLRKPIRLDILKSALDLYICEYSRSHEVGAASESASKAPSDETLDPPASKRSPVKALPAQASMSTPDNIVLVSSNGRRYELPKPEIQARIINASCGESGAIDFKNPNGGNKFFYEPTEFFQHVLKNAIVQCRKETRPLLLRFSDGMYVQLLPKKNVALTNLSDNKLRPRCLMPINVNQVHIEYSQDDEQKLLNDSNGSLQNLDALLWKVSLWSARGRLPLGTSVDTMVVLRKWPNLTRLMAIPQFFRIAALWTKCPSPLKQTVELLNIEARYVFAFFSACYALELVDRLALTESQYVPESVKPKNYAITGILRRLMQRLRII